MNRTAQQNKAIHKYCELLADALNDAGFEMKAVLEVMEVDIPWNPERVKEVLWRKVQIPMTEKESTTQLTTVEVNDVYEVLDRHISSNFGVHVPFPSWQGEE